MFDFWRSHIPIFPMPVGDTVVLVTVSCTVVPGQFFNVPGNMPDLDIGPRSTITRSPVPDTPHTVIPAAVYKKDLCADIRYEINTIAWN